MLFNVVGLIVGVVILIAGIINLVKEKDDAESRKIYGIISLVGIVITVFMIVRLFM